MTPDSEKKHNWENCDCETCGDFRGFKREHHQHDINTSSIDDEKETTEQQSDVVEKLIEKRQKRFIQLQTFPHSEIHKAMRNEVGRFLEDIKHLSSK